MNRLNHLYTKYRTKNFSHTTLEGAKTYISGRLVIQLLFCVYIVLQQKSGEKL